MKQVRATTKALREYSDILDDVQKYYKALREHTLIIGLDSSSKGSRAVFSLCFYNTKEHRLNHFSRMLDRLGFKQRKNARYYGDFVTHCAGRFSLFILDNIGGALRAAGFELPNDYHDLIQYQEVI